MEAGRIDEARTLARFAVEELPGNEPLIAWEAGLATGQAAELDVRALVLQVEPDAEPREEAHDRVGPRADEPEPEAGDHQPGEQPSVRAPESGDEHQAKNIEGGRRRAQRQQLGPRFRNLQLAADEPAPTLGGSEQPMGRNCAWTTTTSPGRSVTVRSRVQR